MAHGHHEEVPDFYEQMAWIDPDIFRQMLQAVEKVDFQNSHKT